jgi:hypothetical protein
VRYEEVIAGERDSRAIVSTASCRRLHCRRRRRLFAVCESEEMCDEERTVVVAGFSETGSKQSIASNELPVSPPRRV